MRADEFLGVLKSEGVAFFSGVPCSLLEPMLAVCSQDPTITYVTAPREDAALGVASGAYLSGRSSGVLLQNSGLGNIVNGLTSFNLLYHVPVFLIISWRGYLGQDAPEHLIMGEKTPDFLELMGIPSCILDGGVEAATQVRELLSVMRQTRLPVGLIVRAGVVQ